MRITGPGIWGPPAPTPTARVALLRRAVELGVDFIDTADSYGPNVSEELIARALAPYDGVVVATKGGLTRSGPGALGQPTGGRSTCARRSRAASAASASSGSTSTSSTAPTRRCRSRSRSARSSRRSAAGKIRHIGLSNVTVAQLEEALGLAEIVSVQNRYSVLDRDEPGRARRVHASAGSRSSRGSRSPPGRRRRRPARSRAIASAHGATHRQIALAWLLASSPAMVPIPGTSQIAHLEENVAAAEHRPERRGAGDAQIEQRRAAPPGR